MIYGVSPFIQKKEVDSHCFGDCGQILCAGADGGEGIGPVFICTHDKCPHEDKTSPILGNIQDKPFKMRKLK